MNVFIHISSTALTYSNVYLKNQIIVVLYNKEGIYSRCAELTENFNVSNTQW